MRIFDKLSPEQVRPSLEYLASTDGDSEETDLDESTQVRNVEKLGSLEEISDSNSFEFVKNELIEDFNNFRFGHIFSDEERRLWTYERFTEDIGKKKLLICGIEDLNKKLTYGLGNFIYPFLPTLISIPLGIGVTFISFLYTNPISATIVGISTSIISFLYEMNRIIKTEKEGDKLRENLGPYLTYGNENSLYSKLQNKAALVDQFLEDVNELQEKGLKI